MSSNPSPTSVPTPTAGPTAVPSVQNVPLPEIPTNAYQLLSNLANAIDTTTTSFNTAAGKLSHITGDITTAVNDITKTSQGTATDALNSLWGNTQTDLNGAHTPLHTITASTALGGSPNQLRAVLDQKKSIFDNGINAMEAIQGLQRSCPAEPPSPKQIEEWIQQVHDLTNALGDVSMALQVMVLAIRGINGGFAAVCATGLVPGKPLPTFNKNAFASQNTAGGNGKRMTEQDLENYLTSKGVDNETASYIAMFAGDQGLSLDEIKNMLDEGLDPTKLHQWLEDGTIYNWIYDGQKGRNLSDITSLLKQGVNDTTMTQLLEEHANLSEMPENMKLLAKRGGTDANEMALWLKDLNSDQLEAMKNRLSQNAKLNFKDLKQLVKPELEYDPNPKHAHEIPDFIGPEPTNGQIALDNSVSISDNTMRRVGIDPVSKEIVVIDYTNNGKYHGHVRRWDQLTQPMKNALLEDGLIDSSGRIILRDSQGNIIGVGDNVKKP